LGNTIARESLEFERKTKENRNTQLSGTQ